MLKYVSLLFAHSLSGYQVLSEPLTVWPSEDHTHGFFFAPTIRCFSLPVAGTFAWREVDAVGTFGKPTECFYRVKVRLRSSDVYEGGVLMRYDACRSLTITMLGYIGARVSQMFRQRST